MKNSWFSLIISCSLIFLLCQCSSNSDVLPYLDTSLNLDDRVDDLVARMTLEEKISQMRNEAPAIERLGVPAYNWWSEGLHGVARAGLATVFPQAIGLGATWDEDLMLNVATTISDEARAKHHEFVRRNKRFLYQGLTLWSPNINIFRDPRWGRGQETYGEDPYLTGRMGVQFIKGLQGDDPDYLKTVATVKHFAVHNGPEPERHFFDAISTQKDFVETYLPQFEMGIKEGKAYSVMCAYNRLNGEACCSSHALLDDLLRKDWEFDGFVVSDCGAIKDIYEFHKLVGTPEEAAAIAVKAGCDLNCGQVYDSLGLAVKKGLITEAEIDVSVRRLFKGRYKLGMFDPIEEVPYANIPYDIVDQASHRELALEAARKSMVLLKNDNQTLPLRKDLQKVAVIGPNADQWLMLLGNYNGVPADPITPLRGIREKLPNAEILYAQGSELGEGLPMFYTIPAENLSHDGSPGLSVAYFNNGKLEAPVLFEGVDATLDVNWNDRAPRDDMDDDNFSVSWSGQLTPDMTGDYQIGVISTCYTRLYLNDSMVAHTPYHFRNEYGDPRLRKSEYIRLEAGKTYNIRIDAIESYADAQVQLVWAKPKPQLLDEALAAAREAEVVIMCMGLTARMEGEEMDVQVDGFRGGDRTKLALPQVQLDLIREVKALGKPIVLVLLNGSALAINWEDENIPAILESWYPGQAAGTAIADVLFGDYNPGGKLPVTFYKSENDLPPFEDYHMTNQTYRFFKGEPLYPFGYGLSYTSFEFKDVEVSPNEDEMYPMTLHVTITNTGSLEGDEVAQVYVKHQQAPSDAPNRTLAGFARIHLDSQESSTLEIPLAAHAFKLFEEGKDLVIQKGAFEITVGGGQPYSKPGSSNILVTKATL